MKVATSKTLVGSLVLGVVGFLFVLRMISANHITVEFDYDKAAMYQFLDYCDEYNIEYWGFGLPTKTINPDRSRKFEWFYSNENDSIKIIVEVPFREKLPAFYGKLPTRLFLYSTPGAWERYNNIGDLPTSRAPK
jgi:hypothetical protein